MTDADSPILHVDMDAFYASVEVRDRTELRGQAVVVGGGPRGVVASASYEARRYGVRSAMPIGRALRLCPHAVVVPADHSRYQVVSRMVMGIFRDVTPLVEPLSLDEAFLDTAGARRLLGSPAAIAAGIRARVAAELGLTCSVGVAPTMFVAKVASARCKPDGLLVVPAGGVSGFLRPLPISVLWGVGPRAAQTLERLGLRTVGDVADTPLDTLRRALGAAAGSHAHTLANGVDERAVNPDGGERSISAEETFPVDTADVAVVARELLRLSSRVGLRLRERSRVAATIGVKIRYADFTTVTRAKTLAEPTDVTQLVYATARELARPIVGDGRAVRLVGVRADRLRPAGDAAHQLSFDEPASGWSDLDRAVDDAARRFGPGALRPAALLTSRERRSPRRPAGRPPSPPAGRPSAAGMPAPWSGHDGG